MKPIKKITKNVDYSGASPVNNMNERLTGTVKKKPNPMRKRNKPANNYKIPPTPRVSGQGWGY